MCCDRVVFINLVTKTHHNAFVAWHKNETDAHLIDQLQTFWRLQDTTRLINVGSVLCVLFTRTFFIWCGCALCGSDLAFFGPIYEISIGSDLALYCPIYEKSISNEGMPVLYKITSAETITLEDYSEKGNCIEIEDWIHHYSSEWGKQTRWTTWRNLYVGCNRMHLTNRSWKTHLQMIIENSNIF
jgi:hypothetical protein